MILSVNPFFYQVLLLSFLISNNSAATDKNFYILYFIFCMGVPSSYIYEPLGHAPGWG